MFLFLQSQNVCGETHQTLFVVVGGKGIVVGVTSAALRKLPLLVFDGFTKGLDPERTLHVHISPKKAIRADLDPNRHQACIVRGSKLKGLCGRCLQQQVVDAGWWSNKGCHVGRTNGQVPGRTSFPGIVWGMDGRIGIGGKTPALQGFQASFGCRRVFQVDQVTVLVKLKIQRFVVFRASICTVVCDVVKVFLFLADEGGGLWEPLP